LGTGASGRPDAGAAVSARVAAANWLGFAAKPQCLTPRDVDAFC